MDLRQGIIDTAKALGMDPVDLATIMSYETAGTLNPSKRGPRTKWGQHRGLIQFGEPQAKKYGIDWKDPVGSQLGENGAVARYYREHGWKPGMGMLDAYSIVNAGGPGRYGARDAKSGGAPGTVADKVNKQMAGHRKKAMRLLGSYNSIGQPPEPARNPQRADNNTKFDPVSLVGDLMNNVNVKVNGQGFYADPPASGDWRIRWPSDMKQPDIKIPPNPNPDMQPPHIQPIPERNPLRVGAGGQSFSNGQGMARQNQSSGALFRSAQTIGMAPPTTPDPSGPPANIAVPQSNATHQQPQGQQPQQQSGEFAYGGGLSAPTPVMGKGAFNVDSINAGKSYNQWASGGKPNGMLKSFAAGMPSLSGNIPKAKPPMFWKLW
jgi:hypothetical protein